MNSSLKRIILNSNHSQNNLNLKRKRLKNRQSIYFKQNSKEFITTWTFLNWDMRKGGRERWKERKRKEALKDRNTNRRGVYTF